MPRKSDAKDKLIRAAARLFHERGFHAVGLTEILEESGAPKGSFYHHFPDGKDQLAEQCLHYSAKKIEGMIEEIFLMEKTFEESAFIFAERVADWFEESNHQAGCPIATIVLETAPQNERLHKAAKEVYQGWVQKVADYAQQRKEFQPDEVDEKSNAILMAFEGAWLVARIQKSREPFLLAAKMCAAL